jgi:hypothetical protein
MHIDRLGFLMPEGSETVDEGTMADYLALELVLRDAYLQACKGKGKDRHADNNAFQDQPICTELKSLKTIAGNVQQIRKKALESMRLLDEAAIKEHLDIIVYAAANVIYLKDRIMDQRPAEQKDGYLEKQKAFNAETAEIQEKSYGMY